MAVSSTLPTNGTFGLYNQFLIRVTTSETTKLKTSYRFEVTAGNLNPVTFTYDLEVNNQTDKIGWTNPLLPLRERYFKQIFFDFDSANPYGYSDVRIRIGESYADTADVPATFRGYDVDETVQVYNGYDPLAPRTDVYYRNPNWFDTTPIKLPIVKKTWYLADGDVQYLDAFSFLKWSTVDDYILKNIVYKSYTVDGIPVDTATTDVSGEYSERCLYGENLGGQIWQDAGNYFQNSAVDYVEVYYQYQTPSLSLVDTEIITVRRNRCNPKYGRYLLRYANRYGADEYQEFILKSTISQTVSRGKTISSDGINYNAALSFDALSFNNQQRFNFGKSSDIFITLNSEYLEQEEVNSLRDLYKSSGVILFTPDGEIVPVMVQDTTYEITDIKDKLKQVSVRLKYSDFDKIQIQ